MNKSTGQTIRSIRNKSIAIFFFTLLIGFHAGAQDIETQGSAIDRLISDGFSSGQDMDTEPNTPDPGGVPVDGGLSLLLAAGAAYGVNRMRKRKESK